MKKGVSWWLNEMYEKTITMTIATPARRTGDSASAGVCSGVANE